MRFPVAIYKTEDGRYDAIVPDLHDCFSTGDTIEEAIANVKEVIGEAIKILTENYLFIPKVETIDYHCNNTEHDWTFWLYVNIDPKKLYGGRGEVSTVIPTDILTIIDGIISDEPEFFNSRSSFITEACLDKILKLKSSGGINHTFIPLKKREEEKG